MHSGDAPTALSFGDDRDAPLSIFLQVGAAGDRQLLEATIGELDGFTPAEASESLNTADFDIAVFDTEGLESALETALARKRAAEPELVPYVLLLPEPPEDPVSLDMDADGAHDIPALIDAIVSMPTTKTEFAWQLRNVGRQRRQSQQLAEQERRTRSKYRSLIDAAPEAVIVTDAESGMITEANTAAEDLFGYTTAELESRHFATLYPDGERDRYEQLYQQILSDAEQDSVTRRRLSEGNRIHVLRKDGTKIPVEIDASLSEFQDRTLVTGIIRDISDRIERLETLQSFKEAAENTDVAIFWTDREGVIQYANPAFEEQTGYAVAEAIGQQPSILKSGDQSDAFYEELWQTISSGETWEGEFLNERKDGERYVVQQTITPVTRDGGHPERFVSVAVDVTDRKRRENKLRRRSRAIEAAPVGIMITDPTEPDNPMIYVNDAIEEITGYPKSELIGENPRIFQGENTDPDRIDEFRTAIENEAAVTIELRNYRKDGTEFWNHMGIAPVRDEDGSVINWAGFQQDVTERKQRMTQLNVINRVLRHNMRNDLNVIKGRADLLAGSVSGADADTVGTITETSERLIELAETGKEITSILQGEPTREAVDLVSTVHSVVADLREDYPAAEISVEANGDTVASPCVEIDMAIRELVVNAIEHNDQETPNVTVTLDGRGSFVELEVRDNGPPIDDADRGLLLGEDPSPLEHGSGLGLWLVNLVVTRSGGSVRYEKHRPRGNRIQLRLP
jgi:PAS domain S-box-containing protein